MPKKAKQRMKQSLTIFGRIWNSSKATPEQKAAAAEHFSDGPGPANRHSDNSERRPRKMKGVGLLVILFVILLTLLIYHRSRLQKSEDAIATEVLDTISASRVAPMQEMKRQSVQPVQQEVTTVSEPEQKQQAAEPETEKPVKTEPEYAPNGEVLIQKPVYPKNGFDSYEEQEEYFKALEDYKRQQKEISDWKIQHGIK